MIYKRTSYFTHNNLKTRSHSLTELNVILVVKERGLSMLSKSKASPYILTLILSFVLSNLYLNLQGIKLKTYIAHS